MPTAYHNDIKRFGVQHKLQPLGCRDCVCRPAEQPAILQAQGDFC